MAILSVSSISDEVGAHGCYATRAPQGATPPYIVFHTVSSTDGLCHGGANNTPEVRIQFDVFAKTPEVVERIRDTLVSMFHGFSGTLNAFRGTEVTSSRYSDEMDDNEWDEELFRKAIDFIFRYRQT